MRRRRAVVRRATTLPGVAAKEANGKGTRQVMLLLYLRVLHCESSLVPVVQRTKQPLGLTFEAGL